jgi:glycosyltransferase involved in cell wall biosynthesis
MRSGPRIVAVTPGPPFDLQTFSGSSLGLLTALRRQGAEVTAVDARPKLLELAEKAASLSGDLERWKQRYNAGASPLSPLMRRWMSALATRRARHDAPDADVVLQMTGYFDPRRPRPGALRCSYHDDNLAGFRQRSDLRIDAGSRWFRRALDYERRLYDDVDLIFCMSDRVRTSFIDEFGQPASKVITVWAGSNVSAPDERVRRPPGPARFLFVGKHFGRKGGPMIVAAFERLRRDYRDAELHIVGPTDLDLELPGVTVHGRISRDNPGGDEALEGLFRDATAFVMPSVYEPLGVAIIEAMAYALPCIGSTAGAMPELIEEGTTGFLVDPGDDASLEERMRRLAGDPALGARLGEAGYERYRQLFTWDSVAERMLATIDARLMTANDG